MSTHPIQSNNSTIEKQWHSMEKLEIMQDLQTSVSGLSQASIPNLLEKYGPNELQEEKKEHPLILLFNQFKSLLIIILVIASVISWSMGDVFEAIAIFIIVLLAGILGFLQEFQAGKAIDSLKKMASPHAIAIRDGEEIDVNASDLVPGDVIVLKAGDKIPADGRLIEAFNLRVEEAALTGESLAVDKTTEKIDGHNIPLGDRKNCVYMGTAISNGRGKAIVTSTGMHTEFGKIAGMLQNTENRKTPLQINLDALGKRLGIFAIGLAVIMSLIGVLRGEAILKMFTWGVALAVAVIPEALPAVVTISLALGVRRMVVRKALVRKLPAVETLGATNIVCSDKTGTLTQDEMTIRKIYTSGKRYSVSGVGYNPAGGIVLEESGTDASSDSSLIALLKAGSLCNDTILKNTGKEWEIIGDPTEGAIIVAAQKINLDYEKLKDEYPRLDEIPFSSETKRMTTINKVGTAIESYSKGAVEMILDTCQFHLLNGEIVPIDEKFRSEISQIVEEYSQNALRVLAIAKKQFTGKNISVAEAEKDMIFLGLVGMFDPPRPEAKAAIEKCFSAGIKPVMITGDHKATAVAVAKELGILRHGNALSGVELDKLSDDEFEKTVEHTEVFARISPAHKLKIVSALMHKGHIVAMTGDGVNDAPSLKKADIGVAMGITGTDVSKEAADMILTDDNFASIVNAVEEGRSIFENIRKYLVFLLSGNMGTVFALIFTMLAVLPIPLSAVQILFINFIMDGLIAIALGVEPSEPGIMKKKPRRVKEGILNRDTLIYIGFVGILIAIVTCGVYVWAIEMHFSEKEAMTMFFVTLIFARLFNGYNSRSLEQSILKVNFFTNKPLLISGLVSVAMSLLVLTVPFLQEVFKVTTLSVLQWTGIICASFFVMLIVEVWKWFINSWENDL